MSKAIFDEAGVKAIPLSVPDVLVGLQTGLVDVVYAPPTVAISLQWFTKVKYLTRCPFVYLAGGIVVKKDTFQGDLSIRSEPHHGNFPSPSRSIEDRDTQRKSRGDQGDD